MLRQRTPWDLTRLAPSGLSTWPCHGWDLPCRLPALFTFCHLKCNKFYLTVRWFSYMCIYIHILFHILSHYGLSQDMEHGSLCYTIGPCFLSISYLLVCICYCQAPHLSLPHLTSPLGSTNLFSIFESVSVSYNRSFVSYFRLYM